ncbi:hypothetical protein ABZ479_27445 [Streptomyces sp. NPDC005722]
MTRGTGPAPHSDPRRARECRTCRGWGTLVAAPGGLALCRGCQLPRQRSGPAVPYAQETPPPRAARYASAAPAVRCPSAER